ncbi:MAG: type II secretion system F family protein [Chloroflexi bacterium]|nr:type II secretion system F family protein [Chloroflexota bacterium]
MSPLLAAFILFVGIVLLFLGVVLPYLGRDPVEERLRQLIPRSQTLEEIELQQPFSERVLKPLIRKLSEALLRMQTRRQGVKKRESGMAAVQRRLNLAGNPYNWTPTDFLGVKAFAALALGGALFFLMTAGGKVGMAIPAAAVAGLLGWFGPDMMLYSKTGARQKEVVKGMPDALDLLVISVEAGLGFDAAVARLCQKSDNALTREFARAQAEMRVGRPRREAMKDIVSRTEVPDLANFISAIIQAEQLGVSVSRVLSIQSDQMRTVRRQRAEQTAAQAPLKMIPVLALFIFPALCIIILGPIWPTIVESGAGV